MTPLTVASNLRLPNEQRGFGYYVQRFLKMRETGLSPEEAEMAAFELNAQDVARVGGK